MLYQRTLARTAVLLALAVCAFGLALGSPSSAPGRATADAVVETSLWRIDLNSISTRTEGGNLGEFNSGKFTALSRGTWLDLEGSATESSYAVPYIGVFDDEAVYALKAASTTDLQIQCKTGDADFSGSASGMGKLELFFEDGPSLSTFLVPVIGPIEVFLLATTGTGFSKGAVVLELDGDLTYKDAVAGAAGDESTQLEGSVGLPEGGAGFSYTPFEGDGRQVPEPAAANDTQNNVSKAKAVPFTLKWRNAASASVRASDSVMGRADVEVSVNASHTAEIVAECLDEANKLQSTLILKIVVENEHAVAQVDIRTTTYDEPQVVIGEGSESFHAKPKKLRSQSAELQRVNSQLLTDIEWGPPAKIWRDISASFQQAGSQPDVDALPAALKLGVRRGSAATYAVNLGGPLKALKTLAFTVAKANARTGRVTLTTKGAYTKGRSDKDPLTVNAFTGKGELTGVLVPSGLDVGDRVYRVGRVVRVDGNRVTVEYKVRRTKVIGVYARDTGWVLDLRAAGARSPALRRAR